MSKQIPTLKCERAQVVDALRDTGVAVVASYIRGDELEALRSEFEAALVTGSCAHQEETPYSLGQCVRMRLAATRRAGASPTIVSFFTRPVMRDIARGYFAGRFGLNREIFAVRDVVGSRHIANDLHFDIQPTLKFFLYLDDTTAANGAFTCVPGSHLRAAAIRAEHGREITFDEREITRIAMPDSELVPVEAAAGSLIVFTTETLHRAGAVSVGQRRVLRGHTRRENLLQSVKNWMA